MNYLQIQFTDDEAKYIIAQLNKLKSYVHASECVDLDEIIMKFHKAIDRLTVEILYRDLEKFRKLELA